MSATEEGRAYERARERYAELGVDTEKAMATLASVPLAVHCWSGDDVGGFERPEATLSGGGIEVTGGHPGRARNADELRMDMEKAFSLMPGPHRANLHAMYGEYGGTGLDRDGIEERHYQGWVDWAKANEVKLDFNATCFSHPKADSGFTLSHYDAAIRGFWLEHVKRCRAISAWMGRELGSPCIHDLWVPDGCKEVPADRWERRQRLRESLDEIYATSYSPTEMKDAVESKLFGIGSEAFVVGSYDFYLGYARPRGIMMCLDMGHFHPTESIADKVSSLLPFFEELLIHVSRGLRWDSDHVVILDDAVRALMEEVVRADVLDRVHFSLDFFDGSLNRVGAWAIGGRATRQALLLALLEPRERLKEAEERGDGFARLALMESMKTMPFGAVWERYCATMEVPAGPEWMQEVADYEAKVTSKRDEGRG